MTIFAAHDFEDGTLGPFQVAGVQGVVSVEDDPTPRAQGKVCKIHYENFPEGGNFDCNQAIAPTNNPGRKLGEDLYCGWRFFLDTDGTEPAIRKFNYWGWSNAGWGFPHAFNLVISSANSVLAPIPPGSPIQFLISAHLVAQDGTQVGCFGPGEGNAGPSTWYGPLISLKAWHEIIVQLKPNSDFVTQDGILRIWFDGVLIFESTDMHWTDPSWTDDPATYQWVDYRIGQQVNGSAKLIEDRYLDSLIFATTKAEVDTFLAGGGGTTPPPPTQVLTTLQLRPTSAAPGVGGTQLLTATALDQFGVVMDLPTLSLHSSNTGIATVTDSPLQINGIAPGTCEAWVSSGAIESNHVSVSVTNPAPVLTSLVLAPTAVSAIANTPSYVNVGAFDQFGASINLPVLINQASNGAVAVINGPPQGSRLEIDPLQVGTAHVWVSSGSIVSNKVTVLVSDPRGGKGHHGHR
jgi:hypothetical protein